MSVKTLDELYALIKSGRLDNAKGFSWWTDLPTFDPTVTWKKEDFGILSYDQTRILVWDDNDSVTLKPRTKIFQEPYKKGNAKV